MNESRVGYATIDAMFDEAMKGIKMTTENNKYFGEPRYLWQAYKMRQYLRIKVTLEDKNDEM